MSAINLNTLQMYVGMCVEQQKELTAIIIDNWDLPTKHVTCIHNEMIE